MPEMSGTVFGDCSLSISLRRDVQGLQGTSSSLAEVFTLFAR